MQCALCPKVATHAARHDDGELVAFCGDACSGAYCQRSRGRKFPAKCELRVAAHELMSSHVYRTLMFVQAWAAGAFDLAQVRDYLLENQVRLSPL